VVLCGAIEGPFDVSGVNPAMTAIAPTLLVTNTGSPFITLQGDGPGVSDLLFHYPNQVNTNSSTPTTYPYTISMMSPGGAKVVRSTVTNAYNFLDIEVGRFIAQNLYIGAFNIGINIDHTYDFVTLDNLYNGVFWDQVESAAYPSPIDTWVLNHGTALVVNQMDALEMHDFFVFSRSVGILLTASPDLKEPGTRSAWGTGSDITLDAVQYGIIADATTQPGFEFTNVQVLAASGIGAGRGPIEILRHQSARRDHQRWLGTGNVGIGCVPCAGCRPSDCDEYDLAVTKMHQGNVGQSWSGRTTQICRVNRTEAENQQSMNQEVRIWVS